MNINSLANAVKPAVLPGEELRVRVIQEGKEAGQGVGFLDDGTMIVVEGGARHIDKRPRRRRHPRAPDRRRADDLRPAAAGLTARPCRRRRDAIVVAAGASSADGGRRQARPASPAARCSPGPSTRSPRHRARAVVRRRRRAERVARRSPVSVAAGRGRRPWWPAAPTPRTRSRRVRRAEARRGPDRRRRRPRPRRRPAARRPALVAAVVGRPPRTGRRSRSCRSPRPSSASTANVVIATVDRPALAPAQTPQGAAAPCCARPWRVPADGRRPVDGRGRAAGGL